jgi:hypothetical protein
MRWSGNLPAPAIFIADILCTIKSHIATVLVLQVGTLVAGNAEETHVVRTQTKLRSVYITSDARIPSARSEPPGHEVTSSGGEDVEIVVSGDIHGSSSCPTVEIKTRALTLPLLYTSMEGKAVST